MYRIEITCTAAQAKAISELMLDLSFQSFAVHSVDGEGALPAPEAKAAKSSFRPSAKNRSLVAVILTARSVAVSPGHLTAEFTTAACEDMCRRIGLSTTTATAALSTSKRHGYVAQLGHGRFMLTDKGRKLANSEEFAHIPLPEG